VVHAVVVLGVALYLPVAAGPHDATTHHAFDDVEHWTSVFDDPARDAWQRPDEIVHVLDRSGAPGWPKIAPWSSTR